MALDTTTRHAIEQSLGVSLKSSALAGSGDISQGLRVETSAGPIFVKTAAPEQADMFAAEAQGLAALAATDTVRVPAVLGTGCGAKAWLALEWLELRPATPASQAQLGEQLARLHQSQADRFGFQINNTIGSTPQPNPWTSDWFEFLGQHRLRHQYDLLALDDPDWAQAIDHLIVGLPTLYGGYSPKPSLLHGDLWSGNQASISDGSPVIFDPACWYGDRESDLAMSALFGGFGESFYAAYQQSWPLDRGYKTRRPLHQLYHVLNHANLFGGGYLSRARQMTHQLLEEIDAGPSL